MTIIFTELRKRILEARPCRYGLLLTNAHTEVVAQTHENFLAGLALYKDRADKGYSLTDCISMTAMRERNISEVLSMIITLNRKVSPSCFSRAK